VIVDAVLQVVAWYQDATYGVNVINGTVPGETSTAVPDVTIYNDVDHAWVARGMIERPTANTSPLLLVDQEDPWEMAAFAGAQAPLPVIPVRTRVLLRGDTNTALRTARQLLRCCVRSIAAPFNDSTFTDITRNGVFFDAPRFRFTSTFEPAGDDVVVGALVVMLPVLDRWSLGGAP
jgi:hypothetical protein